MKLLVLYLLLLKANATAFSGLSSLPVLREDLVVRHQMLSDTQLNLAVTAGRSDDKCIAPSGKLVGLYRAQAPVANWKCSIGP